MKRQRNLKFILVNEKSQSEKPAYFMNPTIWHSEKDKIMETMKRSMVAEGWWARGREMNRKTIKNI